MRDLARCGICRDTGLVERRDLASAGLVERRDLASAGLVEKRDLA